LTIAAALGFATSACADLSLEDEGVGGGAGGKADGIGDDSSAWIATQSWNEGYEEDYSSWVGTLGEARAEGSCSTLTSCLRSRHANTLYEAEDASRDYYADCADLPYVLRAYFAYKNRLPFSFTSAISGERYSSGNLPLARQSFLDYGSLSGLMTGVASQVHSGFYRTSPSVEATDLYPVDINRETIRPGAVYYDPNGHVLVVYAVQDDGTVRFIDGHPDNSLTVQRFGEAHARGSADQGGGFRWWRHQWVEADGRFALERNADSRGFSASAQYSSAYRVNGEWVGYHQWVRHELSLYGSRVRPVPELTEQLEDLCVALQDRVDAVAAAVGAGVHRRAHPDALPSNIYGTSGDWETYSTPSRDARLKAQVRETYRFIEQTVDASERGNVGLEYNGSTDDLVADYTAVWQTMASGCRITYRRSDGSSMTLTLGDVVDRLFDLSFDPYHCPELRWGAPGDYERAPCADDSNKIWWYQAEYRLRNAIDRDYETTTTLSWGPEQVPDIHIGRLLEELRGW